MFQNQQINNEIYKSLGDSWYKGTDYVALLRAEAKTRNPWIINHIKSFSLENAKILDIGCGGGLLSNELAKISNNVTGIDIHDEVLHIAKKYNELKNVKYLKANADNLPFADNTFDIVCAMDLLEHVEDYQQAVSEGVRVLKKNGLFFFHTFNRNLFSKLFIIKGMEWFVKDTPKNLHVYHQFIKPKDLIQLFLQLNCVNKELKGLNLKIFSKSFLNLVFKSEIDKNLQFKIDSSLAAGYIGFCQKIN